MKTKKMLIALLLTMIVLSLCSCKKEKNCRKVIISENNYNSVETLHTYFTYCYKEKQIQRAGDTIRLTGFFDETHIGEVDMGYDRGLSGSIRQLSDQPYEIGQDLHHKYVNIRFADSIRTIPSAFRLKRVYIVSRLYHFDGIHYAKMTEPPYYAFIPLYMDTVPDNKKTSSL